MFDEVHRQTTSSFHCLTLRDWGTHVAIVNNRLIGFRANEDFVSGSVLFESKKSFEIILQNSTRVGFEPTRAKHNGLAVHRLNHSATSSNLLDDKLSQEVLPRDRDLVPYLVVVYMEQCPAKSPL